MSLSFTDRTKTGVLKKALGELGEDTLRKIGSFGRYGVRASRLFPGYRNQFDINGPFRLLARRGWIEKKTFCNSTTGFKARERWVITNSGLKILGELDAGHRIGLFREGELDRILDQKWFKNWVKSHSKQR